MVLITTVATSVTGFGFPLHHFGAPHVVGIISLAVLAVAIYARYRAPARRLVALDLHCQCFNGPLSKCVCWSRAGVPKLPALQSFAPTQTEPPFQVTQVVVLMLFIVLSVVAVIRFHDQPAAST